MTLNLRDLSQKLEDYQFLAPLAPVKANVWAEIGRLVNGVLSLEDPGFASTSVPSNIIYESNRFEAIKALAAIYESEPVLTPAGALTLRLINQARSEANTAPTFGWQVNLTKYTRRLSRDGTYNILVAKGRDAAGNNLVQYAAQYDGPTAWNGAFGPRPLFYEYETLTTPGQLKSWAITQLTDIAARQTQVVPLTALPNPAIQLMDYAGVEIEGANEPVYGRIIGFTYRDVGAMDVDVTLPSTWSINAQQSSDVLSGGNIGIAGIREGGAK